MRARDFTQGWLGVTRWSLELLNQVKVIATAAGRAILDIYQQDDVGIQTKRDQSPLTQADLASHQIIIEALTTLAPDIPILSLHASTTPSFHASTFGSLTSPDAPHVRSEDFSSICFDGLLLRILKELCLIRSVSYIHADGMAMGLNFALVLAKSCTGFENH